MWPTGQFLSELVACASGVVADDTWTGPRTTDGRPQSGIVATGLRCEWREEPEGIVTRAPRLSWVVFSGARSQRQTAYRILMASSPELLTPGTADIWDTGRVASGETLGIAYAGKPPRTSPPDTLDRHSSHGCSTRNTLLFGSSVNEPSALRLAMLPSTGSYTHSSPSG